MSGVLSHVQLLQSTRTQYCLQKLKILVIVHWNKCTSATAYIETGLQSMAMRQALLHFVRGGLFWKKGVDPLVTNGRVRFLIFVVNTCMWELSENVCKVIYYLHRVQGLIQQISQELKKMKGTGHPLT